MRIPESLKRELVASIHRFFGPVPIIIFGSRVHDEKRGGDIDIALKIDIPPAEFEQKRIELLAHLTRKSFPLPLDLVQYGPSLPPLLRQEIDREGVLLNPLYCGRDGLAENTLHIN
ncbi:nucleotidyltransferase family protein [Gracilinema caldarium]|uniref:DNA polymerase beta domain protein region n=1 Tax=Gracilinema caldarium (strain ATCC 51460 / DSM 7334 / H1) TaxID=744872 RepID=F8F2T2_GRAC1|nr:nucleotidyltransferase domain-containing protein [Gracilinema caldarium]AEJ19476.1 DNA polymerase beta domain protein region [Gracilinema caldarium DSM 7334]